KITDPFTTRRSGGTFPKYASLTMGPREELGPATKGRAMVVSGDGLNMPRIQIDTSPASRVHAVRPALRIVFDDSYATIRTAAAGAVVNFVAASASVSARTVRSTAISSGVPE